MIIKYLAAIALTATLAFVPDPSSASGSMGGSAPRRQATNSYAMGKQIYLKRIACDDCKVPGGVASAEAATALLARVNSDEFGFTEAEQMHTQKYLVRRFKLK